MFIIKDWAYNDIFRGKTFDSFEDADEFLTDFLSIMSPHILDDERAFYEEKDEYVILECPE